MCSAANADLVRSLGANRVLDYADPSFAEDPAQYDVVLDAVDKLSHEQATARLKPSGVHVNVVRDSNDAEVTPEALGYLIHLVEQGSLHAVIDRCYPIEQIVDAHRYVEDGHKRGHVVITLRAAAGGEG